MREEDKKMKTLTGVLRVIRAEIAHNFAHVIARAEMNAHGKTVCMERKLMNKKKKSDVLFLTFRK